MYIQLKDGTALASGSLRMSEPVTLKYVGSKGTAVAEFGLRVSNDKNESGEWKAQWVNCKCWNDLAESIVSLSPGASVFVSGKLETRSWAGNDGETKSKTELVCDFVSLPYTGGVFPTKAFESPPPVSVAFSELDEGDGELPF